MPSQLRIAIVGGGPSGLMLGLLLHKRNIPFTIFEFRQKPSNEDLEKVSGMLDLHHDTAIPALKECGLYEDFLPLTGECSQTYTIADRDGTILYISEGGGKRPEISRNNLFKLLSSKIPPDSIKWEHKLLSASQPTTGAHNVTELDFGVHGKKTFDLVIGADGAWSKVRRLLTDVQPRYSGVHLITLTIENVTSKYPHLAKFVGTGSFISLGNKHAIMAQRGSIDSSRVYLWLTVPNNFGTVSALDTHPATSVPEKVFGDDALLGTFSGLSKELIITACEEEATHNLGANLDIRPLYTLPYGTFWEHQPGVTLVGDAAHLMLPNGEGVNAAMHDSHLLSKAICKAYESVGKNVELFHQEFTPLLKEYEVDLVARGKKLGDDTDELISQLIGNDNAAQDFVQYLENGAKERLQQ